LRWLLKQGAFLLIAAFIVPISSFGARLVNQHYPIRLSQHVELIELLVVKVRISY
jgi:hypothetical protein